MWEPPQLKPDDICFIWGCDRKATHLCTYSSSLACYAPLCDEHTEEDHHPKNRQVRIRANPEKDTHDEDHHNPHRKEHDGYH